MILHERDCSEDWVLSSEWNYRSRKMADVQCPYVLKYGKHSSHLGRGEVSNLVHDGNNYAERGVKMKVRAIALLAVETHQEDRLPSLDGHAWKPFAIGNIVAIRKANCKICPLWPWSGVALSSSRKAWWSVAGKKVLKEESPGKLFTFIAQNNMLFAGQLTGNIILWWRFWQMAIMCAKPHRNKLIMEAGEDRDSSADLR